MNQTAGLVGGDIVTAREVQIAAVITRILDDSSRAKGLYEISVKDKRFPEVTASYLIERAAVIEADSFNVGEPQESEIKEAFGKIEKATAGKSYWNSLDPDPETVRRILTLKLKSKKFIKIKSDSMAGIITDSEAQAYFEKNRLKFGDSPFETFKDNIKIFLAQQQKEERLQVWFEVLRKKYKIRNLVVENLRTSQNPKPNDKETRVN